VERYSSRSSRRTSRSFCPYVSIGESSVAKLTRTISPRQTEKRMNPFCGRVTGAHLQKLQVVAPALCCRVLRKEDAPTTDWKGRRPPAGQTACAQHSPEGDRRSAKWGDYNPSVLNALVSTAHSCRGLFLQLLGMRPFASRFSYWLFVLTAAAQEEPAKLKVGIF